MEEKSDRASQMQAQMKAIEKNLKKVKNKIAICSGKGGVGKTTVTANLASVLSMQNLRVGILDVDITGPNIPKVLNLNGMRPNVDPTTHLYMPIKGPNGIKVMSMAFLLEDVDTPVIWRGPMKMSAIRQFLAEGDWGDLDYLLVDLPPGTGDELLDIMQLIPDAGIIVVTTPQEAALNVSRKAISMAKQMNRNIVGIIENMSGFTTKCPKCGEVIKINIFGEGGGLQAAVDFDVTFLGSIPLDLSMRELADTGYPIVLKEPENSSSKLFVQIINKITEKFEI